MPFTVPPPCPVRARLVLALSLAALLGCATAHVSLHDALGSGPAESQPVDRREGVPSVLDAVLAGARATLGQSHPELDGRRIPTDCSGYIRGLYARAGIDLFAEGRPSDNGVRAIARWIERHGVLQRRGLAVAGDLVFFDNSYDRNGDRRLNDPLTHVGLVETVLPDGTLLIVHATNHGIVREPMNLARPHDSADADGRELNAWLRRKGAGDGPRTPHLMAELFAGFGRVFPGEEVARIETANGAPRGRAARRLAR
jgi:hypothetical protein